MARNGKIARLSYAIREQINSRMADGQSAKTINAALLAQHLIQEPLSDANYSRWRSGGYKEWEAGEQKRAEKRKRAEGVRRDLEAEGFSILDKGLLEIAEIIVESSDVDPIKAAAALSAMKNAVTAEARVQTDKQRAAISERQAQLDEKKYRLQFAEAFLQFFHDQQARAIAESGSTHEAKISDLVAYMDAQEK